MEQGKYTIFYKWAKIALHKGGSNIKFIIANLDFFCYFIPLST